MKFVIHDYTMTFIIQIINTLLLFIIPYVLYRVLKKSKHKKYETELRIKSLEVKVEEFDSKDF